MQTEPKKAAPMFSLMRALDKAKVEHRKKPTEETSRILKKVEQDLRDAEALERERGAMVRSTEGKTSPTSTVSHTVNVTNLHLLHMNRDPNCHCDPNFNSA